MLPYMSGTHIGFFFFFTRREYFRVLRVFRLQYVLNVDAMFWYEFTIVYIFQLR